MDGKGIIRGIGGVFEELKKITPNVGFVFLMLIVFGLVISAFVSKAQTGNIEITSTGNASLASFEEGFSDTGSAVSDTGVDVIDLIIIGALMLIAGFLFVDRKGKSKKEKK